MPVIFAKVIALAPYTTYDFLGKVIMRRAFPLYVVFFLLLTTSFALAAPMRVIYGFNREFPPFSYENPGGQATGFEVEIMEAIFAEANVTLVKRPLQWDLVPLELSSGAVTVTAGMVQTGQHSRLFLFSDKAVFPLHIKLFTKTYKRHPSLGLYRGLPVAVEENSFSQRLLEQYGGMNIKPLKDKGLALRDLYNDAVSAYCGPVPNTYYYINKLNYGAITTVGSPLAIVSTRIAVNKNRGDILRLVNEGLERIMNNGEYARIYRNWFVRELSKEELTILAKSAAQGGTPAYAPYSGKTEGAAILTATGKIITGCTVENADPTLNISAMQSALASAIAQGEYEITAATLVNDKGEVIQPTQKDLQALHELNIGTLIPLEDKENGPYSAMVLELLEAPVFKDIIPLQR